MELEHYCKYGNLDKVKAFLEIHPIPLSYKQSLKNACQYNHIDIILYFIVKFHRGTIAEYVLVHAINNSYWDVVRAILNIVDIKRLRMDVCMIQAVRHGNLRLLKRILCCIKCDMNSLFMHACLKRRLDIIDFLIHGDFTINWMGAIEYMGYIGCVERFKIIESRCGIFPDKIVLACLKAAGLNTHFDLFQYVFDKYAQIELHDDIYTLLNYVSISKNTELIMLIVNRYKEEFDMDMQRFLNTVCYHSCDMINYYCTHPEFDIYATLDNAVWGADTNMIKCLLSKVEPDAKFNPRYRWRALLEFACINLDVAAFHALLPYVLKPNWHNCFEAAYKCQNYGPMEYILEHKLIDLSTITLNLTEYSTKSIMILMKYGIDVRPVLNVAHIRELIDLGTPFSYFKGVSDDIQDELAIIQKIQHDYIILISESTRLLDDLVRIIVLYLPFSASFSASVAAQPP